MLIFLGIGIVIYLDDQDVNAVIVYYLLIGLMFITSLSFTIYQLVMSYRELNNPNITETDPLIN